MTRKLFVSYTTLIREIKEGTVTQADLDNGLFYFGCCEVHVRNPGAHGSSANEINWFFAEDKREGQRVLRRIRHAIDKAKREGRVMFRELNKHNSYRQLNALLRAQGLPAVHTSGVESDMDLSHYSYAGVAVLVKEHTLPLEVVY